MLDAGRARSLAERGFFRVDGFADPGLGRGMLERVVELARRAAAGGPVAPALVLPEAQPGFRGERPEDRISKVFRLHRDPAFTPFLRDPRLAALLEGILGPDVDCFLSQFIFKNPGAWGQPWHQDSFYFPFEPPRPIVAGWLAVTRATLENGCLHVLPGSHREPVHPHEPDRRPGANYGYTEITCRDTAAAEAVLMAPGDLLVFDSHLMHRSTDNASEGMRAAMVFHFCRAGTRDLTQARRGVASPVNDFAPLLRGGRAVA